MLSSDGRDMAGEVSLAKMFTCYLGNKAQLLAVGV